MLTREENERMCRVGPDTPMGKALRRYWLPALASDELPGPDAGPRRIQLLGEDFVAFRDSSGRVGFLDEYCAHRGASLALGRVEDCGIRCLYHGWKFAADGQIVETPNMPNPQYKERFRASSYPVTEAGSLIWVYLGPPELAPSAPNFAFFNAAPDRRIVVPVVQKCNFVQIMEGFVDSSHLNILHQDALGTVPSAGFVEPGTASRIVVDTAPRLELQDTPYGFRYAAIRDIGGPGAQVDHARVTVFMMPVFAMTAPTGTFIAAVPMNDEKTLFFNVFWDTRKPLNTEPLRTQTLEFFGLTPETTARMGLTRDTCDLPGAANRDNNFLQDREAMKTGASFTGVPNFVPEDAVITLSMSSIYDRTREHLVPADVAVIRMRRLLLRCADLAAKGEAPIGVGVDQSRIGAASGELSEGRSWTDLVPELPS